MFITNSLGLPFGADQETKLSKLIETKKLISCTLYDFMLIGRTTFIDNWEKVCRLRYSCSFTAVLGS